MDALKKSLEDLKETFDYRMREFQSDLQNSNSESSSPSSRIASDFSVFRTLVITSLCCLQSQVELLARVTDQMETSSHRKILLVHGIPEEKKENIVVVAAKSLANHLSCPELTSDAFTQCHRMGQLKPYKPRPILIKCKELSTKNKLWQNKTALMSTGFTLPEFLTKARHDAFMAARKKSGLNKCYTGDGSVFVLDATGKRNRIFAMSDLDVIAGGEDTNLVLTPAIKPEPKQKPKRALRNK